MYIAPLKIGNVILENNIVLAPMAGITDRPYRMIAKEYGPGLVYTEMISSKGLFYHDMKTMQFINTKDEKRPISIQIFGSEVESMVYAATYLSPYADLLDINMGCPAPKIVKNGDGSRLLLDLPKAQAIVTEVVKASRVPVTVKIRTGWDPTTIVAVEAAKRFEQAGVSCITIHGRTRSQFYSGKADWHKIKEVKEAVCIPVIGNGDITSKEEAKAMFEQTGVDGIMIGRASLGNPWLFREIIQYLKEEPVEQVTAKEKLETILQHIRLEVEEKGEEIGIKELRKHMSAYIKNQPNATTMRETINKIQTRQELEQTIIQFFTE